MLNHPDAATKHWRDRAEDGIAFAERSRQWFEPGHAPTEFCPDPRIEPLPESEPVILGPSVFAVVSERIGIEVASHGPNERPPGLYLDVDPALIAPWRLGPRLLGRPDPSA